MKKRGFYLVSIVMFAVLSHGATAGDAEITLKAGAPNALPTDKRQHKPVVLTKPVDKAKPMSASKTKSRPVPRKVGDITLKRGVMGKSSDAKGKGKGGKAETTWKVEKGEK